MKYVEHAITGNEEFCDHPLPKGTQIFLIPDPDWSDKDSFERLVAGQIISNKLEKWRGCKIRIPIENSECCEKAEEKVISNVRTFVVSQFKQNFHWFVLVLVLMLFCVVGGYIGGSSVSEVRIQNELVGRGYGRVNENGCFELIPIVELSGR